MPTRLPTGLAFHRPRLAANTAAVTFTAGDTTPDVSSSSFWLANPTSAVTITNFDFGSGTLGDAQGMVLYVLAVSNNLTTIQDSAGGIVTAIMTFSAQAVGSAQAITTGGNVTMTNGEILAFIWHRNTWFQIDPALRTI